jgi:putative drug exporter of the RND superfamily
VFFSPMKVPLSMIALVLFPMSFLKSFAYAGVAVVAFAAAAAVLVTPAAIVLLGARLDALDVRRCLRRLLGRPTRYLGQYRRPRGSDGQKPLCATPFW